VRYKEFADQLAHHPMTMDSFAQGIRRFSLGLGKKVLIANQTALVADQVFSNVNDVGSTAAWLGVIFYSIQIFFDFSGYSDMAIGLGQMFGFRIPENFHYPYAANSIRDFWQRWHITLSNWFRDYVYIPLGGNRKGIIRTYLNLYIVFFLTGLWHGASWLFIIWGLIHGTMMVVERIFDQQFNRMWQPLRHFYTLFVVLIAWVFFRAETLPDAMKYLYVMITPTNGNLNLIVDTQLWLVLIIAIIASLPLDNWYQGWISKSSVAQSINHTWMPITATLFSLVIFSLAVLFLSANTYNPFIYFRF